MRKSLQRISYLLSATLILASLTSCTSENPQKSDSIFPKGDLAPKNNTGDVWVEFLVPPDSIYTTAIGNETFAPGARTHWHAHPGGEILMVTEGTGYHKVKGKPIEVIQKGDVVKCPPNMAHWHGAAKDKSMAHIFVIPNTEKGIVKWREPVTDEELNLTN